MSKIIRAADFLIPEQELAQFSAEGGIDSDGLPQLNLSDNYEGLVRRLFGSTPDYRDPRMEALWSEVAAGFRPGIIAWCKQRGVDVLGPDGKPVRPWRDIAVMLMANERGYFAEDTASANGKG